MGCLESSKQERKLPLRDNEKNNIETLCWKRVDENNNLITKTFDDVSEEYYIASYFSKMMF